MTQLATTGTPTPVPVHVGKTGVMIRDLEGLWRFSKMVMESGFSPKGMNQAAIATAVQTGMEVGLSPMAALQSIAVINGRPGMYGDAAKALCEASGLVEDYDQWYEIGSKRVDRLPAKLPDDCVCVVSSKRIGRRPIITSFSVADAKAAGLWAKAGPWSQYPARMLMFRARGFNLRDNFGDVLKGMRTTEELGDMPPMVVDATVTTNQATGAERLMSKLAERSAPPPVADPVPETLAEGEVPAGELFDEAEPVASDF